MISLNKYYVAKISFGFLIAISLILCGYFLIQHDLYLIIIPCVISIFIFYVFYLTLKKNVKNNLIAEVGFLYIVFLLAYTLIPAYIFLVLDLDNAVGWSWTELKKLDPSSERLAFHLWRHCLFICCVSFGYIIFRGKNLISIEAKEIRNKGDIAIIAILLITLIIIATLNLNFSTPVSEYIDSYTRYDALSPQLKFFVSLLSRLSRGMIVVLLVLLFANYKKNTYLIWMAIISLILFEFINTYGARIEILFMTLYCIFLYSQLVKNLNFKIILFIFILLFIFFTALEIFRASNFDMNSAINFVSDFKIQPASEFGSVFITGYHLYDVKNLDLMPSTDWPMLFSDFINIVLPNSYTQWNPMYWYATAFYPESVVPPATLGPIADSAIWGGEIDLAFRGLLNGIILALLVRFLIANNNKWWAVVIYTYCYGSCIMAIKYSPIYMLNPIIKTFSITLLAIFLLKIYAKKLNY